MVLTSEFRQTQKDRNIGSEQGGRRRDKGGLRREKLSFFLCKMDFLSFTEKEEWERKRHFFTVNGREEEEKIIILILCNVSFICDRWISL